MDESELSEEILLLEEIYIQELEVKRNSSGRTESVALQLHPATGEDLEQRYVCMTLILDLPEQYPDVSPEFTIKNPRGVNEEEIQSLLEDMHKLCEERRGGPVLYELIELAKEILTVGNIPHCPCAICLEHFTEGDNFTRTECYHFFHESCLARYVGHEVAKTPEVVPAHSNLADMKKNKLQCPICREEISYEPNSLQSLLSEEPIKYVPSPEMRALQKKMAATLERQRAKGGIIDVEAEKNKYLVRDDDVILLNLPKTTENNDRKTDKNKRSEKGDKFRRLSPRENSYSKDEQSGAYKKVKSDSNLIEFAERYDKDYRPLSGFRKRMGRGVTMKDGHAYSDEERWKEQSRGRQPNGNRDRTKKDTGSGAKGDSEKQGMFDKRKSEREYSEDNVKDRKGGGKQESSSSGEFKQKQERKGFGVPPRPRSKNEEVLKESTTASKNNDTYNSTSLNQSHSCDRKNHDKKVATRDDNTSIVKDEQTRRNDFSKSKDIREDRNKLNEKHLDSTRGDNGSEKRLGSGYRRRQERDYREQSDSYYQRHSNRGGNRRGSGDPRGRRDANENNNKDDDSGGVDFKATQTAGLGRDLQKGDVRNDTGTNSDRSNNTRYTGERRGFGRPPNRRYTGERRGFGIPPNRRHDQKSEDGDNSSHVENKNEKKETKTGPEVVNSNKTGETGGEVVRVCESANSSTVKVEYKNDSNDVQHKSGRQDGRKSKPPGFHNQVNQQNNDDDSDMKGDNDKIVTGTRYRGRGRGYNRNKYRSDAMKEHKGDMPRKENVFESLPKQMSDLSVKGVDSKDSSVVSSLCSKKPPGFNRNPPPGIRPSDRTCDVSPVPSFHS
ncbi:dentin sialophosphoprotein-like [Mya arenaria]|uniref:dentin sialophosphoprotein-like n=1 Tax=Mya arenaria TaxID=6604 RepID=UPI0022E89378|nr:dentin sialophosphoprotein-like [Mya arenaria]